MSAFNSVDGFWIVLVANFVNGLSLALSHVKLVWTVDHDAGNITDILISVDNTLWY